MGNWYDKYMTIYEKPFNEVSQNTIDAIRNQLEAQQNTEPLVSVVVISYNEERRLAACLWSLSEFNTQYPLEILGVNNNSNDHTEDVYKSLGLPYFNEARQSPGYARLCGLRHARGKYHFFIDADTFYPSCYVDKMMEKLLQPGISCVGTFWSFYPDKRHSRFSLFCFELVRDIFLWIQHFKRPELNIRGMTFAFNADYARQCTIRTDIRRGEDGSLALSLKKYGKIAFLYNRKARPVTGYGTIGNHSMWNSFIDHVKFQMKDITRIFHSTDYYKDSEDNLMKK